MGDGRRGEGIAQKTKPGGTQLPETVSKQRNRRTACEKSGETQENVSWGNSPRRTQRSTVLMPVSVPSDEAEVCGIDVINRSLSLALR